MPWGRAQASCPSKGDCAPKKQKVSSEPVLGLMVKGTKTVTPTKHGGGKGFIIPPLGSQKKLPIYSAKIPSMPWRSSRRLLASRIMKTWEIIWQRPWGRQVVLLPLYILYLKLTPFLFRPCSWRRGWWNGLSITRWCFDGCVKKPSWRRKNCSS